MKRVNRMPFLIAQSTAWRIIMLAICVEVTQQYLNFFPFARAAEDQLLSLGPGNIPG